MAGLDSLSPCCGQPFFRWAFPTHSSGGIHCLLCSRSRHDLCFNLEDPLWELGVCMPAGMCVFTHVCFVCPWVRMACAGVRNGLGGPGSYQPLAVMSMTVVVTANTLTLSPLKVASIQPTSSCCPVRLSLPEPDYVPIFREHPVPLSSLFLVPW